MATGASLSTASQLAGGLSQSLDNSPQSGSTSGDAKGGTTGDVQFGNVNFGGSQSNSTGANWLVIGAVAGACVLIYFLTK